MDNTLPAVYLARHGETDWSVSGQHTGISDIPLTQRGQRNAQALGRRLEGLQFAQVYASPLKRALHTCQLAGFATVAQIEPDLVEWNYGQYEGLTSREIHASNPNWDLFRHGAPEGETVAQIAQRADRMVEKVRAVPGNVLIFSSGHLLRVLAARWIGLEASAGRLLTLDTASLSIVGYEHYLSHPVIRLWNDTRHTEQVQQVQP